MQNFCWWWYIPKVHNINKSVNELNADLEKISQWTYQWKMQFNPDPNKQAHEDIFSCKSDLVKVFRPPIKFNNNSIAKCPSQKHLVIMLDSKLNFNSHVDEAIKKCNKVIGLIRRLSMNLPRKALGYINHLLDLTLTMVIFCMITK